jgi:NhaA family Na+:H+ antiporter
VPGSLVGAVIHVDRRRFPMNPRPRAGRARFAVVEFLRTEQSAGVVLLLATIVALVWANVSHGYESAWTARIRVGPLRSDLRHLINDGFMSIFFFVVGLEIKRELVVGELRDRRTAALPALAAIGGMVFPALLYLAFNAGGPARSGWAIPMATDIAFVIGVMALLGDRAPQRLRVFLLTLAIVDDVGAIVIIALAYSGGTVHPTLIGAALALSVPARPVRARPILEVLERYLHPVASYAVVPIFALANAGVLLSRASLRGALGSPVFWGIVIGLAVGKPLGIIGISLVAVRGRIGRLPAGVSYPNLVGGGALAGIGFTVSLFVVTLAFTDAERITEATLGVLAGSVVSGILGTALLLLQEPRRLRRS